VNKIVVAVNKIVLDASKIAREEYKTVRIDLDLSPSWKCANIGTMNIPVNIVAVSI
jgi:hypothetical protein